jgi:Na+/H+ antiporter NhaD/arsenite permease-like protein
VQIKIYILASNENNKFNKNLWTIVLVGLLATVSILTVIKLVYIQNDQEYNDEPDDENDDDDNDEEETDDAGGG